MNEQLTIQLIERAPDGTNRIGHTVDLPYAEACRLIGAMQAKLLDKPIGVLPDGVTESPKKTKRRTKSWHG